MVPTRALQRSSASQVVSNASSASRTAATQPVRVAPRTRKRDFSFQPSIHSNPYFRRRQQHFLRAITFVAAAGISISTYQYLNGPRAFHAEEPADKKVPADGVEQAAIEFEKLVKPKDGVSKDEFRSQISSQHLQVQKSWENPGVWLWGDNAGRVASPDSKEGMVKNPKWSAFFDGRLLKDLKLTRQFGAAIDEHGDLIQWGSAYSDADPMPKVTLKGKGLKELAISRDRVLALSSSGKVYSLSSSQSEQALGPKPSEASWIPGLSARSAISYRNLTPTNLSWNEKVTSLASGLEHGLLVTSKGRVYSFASASEAFPTRGQFGIAGLTWLTRPAGAYDQPHEIHALSGFPIAQVAAGDYHSVALDRHGRVFAWGDNQKGQLGIGETSREVTFFDAPALVPIARLYQGTAQKPRVTRVMAGGNTTFFTVDAERVAPPGTSYDTPASHLRGLGRVTADTWACGHGIWGQLGNGRWTHVQALPTKIAALSGMFEYDEVRRRAVPIRMRDVSVGATHCVATMDNVTYVAASAASSDSDTNWGADVVWFGNNEFYQLGTGKRNNVVTPTYIQPLDRVAEVREGGRPKGELHRFHATPMSRVKVGGRWVNFEQRVVAGRGLSAVYSGV